MTPSTELTLKDEFLPSGIEASALWAEEMEGSEVEFPTVKTPKGGSTTFEVEGEDPTREIRGVVVDDFEAHVLYRKPYSGDGEAVPPEAYWILGELQYMSSWAIDHGYNEESYKVRGDKLLSNRQVLYVARPANIVPLMVDLSGASARPWRLFKQNQIVSQGKRVTDAALSLTLERKDYKSGFSGALLVPKLLGFLDDDQAAAFRAQREQIRPFTRVRHTPNWDDQQGVVDTRAVDTAATTGLDGLANALSGPVDDGLQNDDIPF